MLNVNTPLHCHDSTHIEKEKDVLISIANGETEHQQIAIVLVDPQTK